nr:uncharacterized protein LOC113701356 [Coffea arabica]
MQVAASMLILSTPLKNLNKSLLLHHNLHNKYHPFLPSFSVILTKPCIYLTPMATISSNSITASDSNPNNNHKGGAFTTIKERVTFQKEIKKSKFIAIAGTISNERSAQAFLTEVGDQFRSNDDGEPSGTAGKPILSAIESSGIDRVMVVVIRYFGGIKLGTGGLVRAYGGVAADCLRNAPTCLVKSKVPMGLEIPYDLLGVLYHQLQSFRAEDIKQDYDTGKDGVTMVTFKVDFDQMESLEEAIKVSCSRDIVFFKR